MCLLIYTHWNKFDVGRWRVTIIKYLFAFLSGNETCREEKVPKKFILTKPRPPPKDTFDVEAFCDKIALSWTKPEGEGHTFIDGYKITIKSAEEKLLRDITVSKHQFSYTIDDIIVSATQYTVTLASVCRYNQANIWDFR